MAEVELIGVSKRFGRTQAVHPLDLSIEDGEFVVLLGPTGAGKTTTLRLIAGLERPDAGQVLIDGDDVTRLAPANRNVSFVFQQYSLYPHLSVRDNLKFPLKAPGNRLSRREREQRVNEVAAMVRIDHKLDNRATQLSGGEMQRVAIARALVRTPTIFLMDEPLSSLDAKLRADLRLELKRIQQDLGATILYVTHDQTEALTMATAIGVLNEGRLVQMGSPREIFTDPIDTYVATRLGTPRINLVPADLFADAPMPRGTHTLGLRTEHLALTRSDTPHKSARMTAGAVPARVTRVEHLGDQGHLHIETEAVGALAPQTLLALVDPHDPLRAGDRVQVTPRRPLYFDGDGRRLR